ncbi:MAG TPA: DNA recombination protein RmuC [Myxococcota bacterium]|nr:DNA recombination protein RmuC [Myxococcota bacterium]
MPSLPTTALALSFGLGLLLGALAAAAYFAASRAAALARLDAAERLFSERPRDPSLESVITPLAAALRDHQRELRALEERRLVEGTRTGDALAKLSAETARLVGALRPPHGRGRWGELTLRRVAELAGLSAHCDFAEQASVETEQGRLRPDMLVRLPGGRTIVVDAKAPLGDGLEALELEAGPRRNAALNQHARLVRRHVEALASRSYPSFVPGAPAFVVLFLPSDALLAAAAEGDRDLVESALHRRVVLATPATLFALLAGVAQSWSQEQVSEGAQRVAALGQELSDRLAGFTEHLGRLGGAVAKTVELYNAALGSFDARVLPHARRLREASGAGRKELVALAPVEERPRDPRGDGAATMDAT